jgi:hypothetical protein
VAGRSFTRAKFEAEQLRLKEARDLPTEQRSAPIDYQPALCAEIIELAALGLASAEIASHWAVSEETMKGWEEAHTEFKDAAQRARTRAKGLVAAAAAPGAGRAEQQVPGRRLGPAGAGPVPRVRRQGALDRRQPVRPGHGAPGGSRPAA